MFSDITALMALFQSTLLMRGATFFSLFDVKDVRFQSTLLMRGATIQRLQATVAALISIHAPHARSDGIMP